MGEVHFISSKNFQKPFSLQSNPTSPPARFVFPSLPPEPPEVLHTPMSINQWLFCMLKFLRGQEGRRWSCLAAKGTGCSHGGWERGSPGAILGWRLEDLFVQENDRVSLVWSELSQRWSFQWHLLQRTRGEDWLKMGLIAVGWIYAAVWCLHRISPFGFPLLLSKI